MHKFKLETEIKKLGLSVRATNGLYREGYKTLDDIINLDQFSLQKIRNLGRKSIKEILNLTGNLQVDTTDIDQSKSEFVYRFAPFGISTGEEQKLKSAGILSIFDLADFGKWPLIKGIVSKNIETLLEKIIECKSIYPFDMDTSILEFNMSVRAKNCLRRAGFITIQDLINAKDYDLLNIKNLGVKTEKELFEYKNIILAMMASNEEYSEKVEIDIELIQQISDWNKLDFLNITNHISNTFDIKNVSDLITVYKHVFENEELYNNDMKRNLIFYMQSLEEIIYIMKNELENYIESEMKSLKLSERDIDILSKRYNKTLEEIARDYNITRERVRQIEVKKARIVSEWFENNFLSNIILIDNVDGYINDNTKLAIYYSAYGSNSIVYKTNGIKRYYSSSMVNKYRKLVAQLSTLIDYGFQPEINYIFRNFLSKKHVQRFQPNLVDFQLINICNFSTEQLAEIDKIIKIINYQNEEEFIIKTADELMKILKPKIADTFNQKNAYIDLIRSEITSFLHSIYNLIQSNWMFKFSDRFLEIVNAISRKYSYELSTSGVSLSNNSIRCTDSSEITMIFEKLENEEMLHFLQDILQNSKQIDFSLLESILVENNFSINITSITKRSTIVSISESFMKRYKTTIDTRSEEMITQLSYYFNEHNRYIFRSRNIINSLLEAPDIVNLDNSRFLYPNSYPLLVEEYCMKINSDIICDPVKFYLDNIDELQNNYIFDENTLILVIESLLKDNLIEFGESRYMFSKKNFCTNNERTVIKSELTHIIDKYKNPSYKSIFEKLDKDTLIYNLLQKHQIQTVDEFVDFISTLDLKDIEIFDKTKSSRLGTEKTKELKRRLDSYTEGFTFDNLITILDDYGNHAVNIKYVYLDNYYQIDKEKFISKRHLKRVDIEDVSSKVKYLDSDYITLDDIRAILPIWINPYFAMSIIKHTNQDYSPIEQHGILQIHNPILAHRRTNIYSLYNLIYLILSEEYSGSFTLSAVIKHLRQRGIIIQKEMPKYFYDLGFGEVIDGVLMLKGKSNRITNEDEIFSIIDDFLD